MKHQYDIDIKKTLNSFKRALVHNDRSLIFVAQVVRYGSGPSLKWTYKKMLETREGGRLAYESEEIAKHIPTLSQRPDGSVGKKCYDVFGKKLIEMLKITRRKSNDDWIEAKHPYSWMARRYRDTHDVWHVLAGYPMTPPGEMCLTMFSFAQTRSLSWLIISLGILRNILKIYGFNTKVLRMVYEAYKRGKEANFLLAEDYDKLFSENLEDARKRLNIRPAKHYIDIGSKHLI